MEKPQIQYPCTWNYRIIGESKERLVEIAFDIIDTNFNHTPQMQSKNGKYHSINIEVVVQNEEHRNDIFKKLQKHEEIKFVL
ncbi:MULTISPECIES: HP0495 family protein [Helicobacter]|uniref:DUF493 domain-containing protein n=1 Tax=Helicobacter ibis TaxID=2962633 RepID=A0ABT4VE15_9HELI|nr:MULTISPECIES: DUF493 domain-containing protein [Helicobacter]MDA3966461.1 DUF493 domain-containing protein [Helicobacter sp. WB40]MDA3968924.1 DUF493 domain-containing protein [Helicobacter ibis]